MSKKETVIILGAGSSADSGGPLMSNFLDVAEDLLRIGAFSNRQKIEEVFELIGNLQPLYAKSYLDLNNIEGLFGVIEMALITGRLGNYTHDKLKELQDALKELIVETLEQSIKFQIDQTGELLLPSKSYLNFAHFLSSKKITKTTSIVTFNYDLCVELALFVNHLIFNYCLNGQTSEGINLLKLHGSINWTTAKDNNRIIPHKIKDVVENQTKEIPRNLLLLQRNKSMVLSASREFRDRSQIYGTEISKTHVIVPPTWNKTHYHGSLAKVWTVAAESFASARNILVFGYSLPETDSFFRYLFATGTISSSQIKKFFVFDPDPAVEERYLKLLGPSLQGRFKFYNLDFRTAIQHLEKHYK